MEHGWRAAWGRIQGGGGLVLLGVNVHVCVPADPMSAQIFAVIKMIMGRKERGSSVVSSLSAGKTARRRYLS